MLTKQHINRYADVLLWGLKTSRSGTIEKNDKILIRYDAAAVELAEILFARLVAAGMNPIQRVTLTPGMEKSFYTLSDDSQLEFRVPGEDVLFGALNGSIYLHAPDSITHLGDIDSSKIAKTMVARKYLRDILDKREEQGLFSWTLCTFPTPELALQAGLSMDDYCKQVIKACFLNRKDPVAQWQEIFRKAAGIKTELNQLDVTSFHVESDHVDLKVSPGRKRKWIGISGHNIPSFELFFSPDWRGTSGIYYADQPSFRNGNYVRGVRLEFQKGEVVRVTASEGEEFVKSQLKIDSGARRLGEFSLTDKRFSKIDKFMANTLFDENYGGKYGNCHVALGSAYSDAFDGDPAQLTPALKRELGFNTSAIHWDLVNTEKKRVTAHLKSGEKRLIYENGLFL